MANIFNQFSSLFRLPGAQRRAGQAESESRRLQGLLAQRQSQRQASLGSPPKSSQGGLSAPVSSPTPSLPQMPQPAQISPQNQALQAQLSGLRGGLESLQRGLQSFQKPVSSGERQMPGERLRPSFEGVSGLFAPSGEEEQLRMKLANLLSARGKGLAEAESAAVPLQSILGEQSRIEKRALAGATPLSEQLAQLQQRRASQLEAAKFQFGAEKDIYGLEQKEGEAERSVAEKARAEAESTRRFGVEQETKGREFGLSEQKFEEDKRQFGQEYALAQRKVAIDEAKATAEGKGADRTTILSNKQIVDDLLQGDKFKAVTGFPGVGRFFPKYTAPEAYNKYQQLKGILALDKRQLLKGSGQISDYESRVLDRAASALDTNLSNEAFGRELKRIRGVFTTAAGLEANVKVIDPSTGQAKSGLLNRKDIDDALSQGYSVEYE